MKRSHEGFDVCLLTIGREILTGRTLDTNAHWLAGRVTRMGGRVRQMTSVDDRSDEIAAEIRAAQRLGADVLITTGGLGPTHDDLTLTAVAAVAGKRLRLNTAARAIVEERYRSLQRSGKITDPAMNSARLKMARLPTGAIPLDNSVGTAPGALLVWRGLHIFCLPGVPAEMRAIFTSEVAPRLAVLLEAAGPAGRAEVTLRTRARDESKLAAVLLTVRRSFPEVYVKSHPSGFGASRGITVTFAATGRSAAEARLRARAARDFLSERLERS
jgi:nicotinamide-nucleotide amidase